MPLLLRIAERKIINTSSHPPSQNILTLQTRQTSSSLFLISRRGSSIHLHTKSPSLGYPTRSHLETDIHCNSHGFHHHHAGRVLQWPSPSILSTMPWSSTESTATSDPENKISVHLTSSRVPPRQQSTPIWTVCDGQRLVSRQYMHIPCDHFIPVY